MATVRRRLKAESVSIHRVVHLHAVSADPLTPAVSDRICRHMNVDHADAVLAYAHHYAGLRTARSARMLAVLPELMRLEVDGTPVEVPFDHPLTDSEDAHRTLVAMLRSLPGNP